MRGPLAQVVIGANFGDEGKGLLTDYFASRIQGKGFVVRFNGGAQAGHTVQTPEGLRHVFSHFGSGTFCDVPTFLSQFFVCNPILFHRERQQLLSSSTDPKVFVDPRAVLTTPYDIMINQMAEDTRGSLRHGSCGLGFGETLQRNQYAEFRLTVGDLFDQYQLKKKLDGIRRNYMPQRLRELGLVHALAENEDLSLSDGLLAHFIQDAVGFLDLVTVADTTVLRTADAIVFEGAQGLLLDQDRGSFPHVTRSYTGLRNVLAIAHECDIQQVEATYVSRAYLTRHGAGPMPNEMASAPYPEVVDHTNVHNTHQGSLRFGILDLDVLASAIGADLGDAKGSGINVLPSLAITCMDQLGDQDLRFVMNGQQQEATSEEFLNVAQAQCYVGCMYVTRGPTRVAVSAKESYMPAQK